MKKPFTLVQETVSHDTIEALEFLLEQAREGELIGIAYGAMLKNRYCMVDTAGEAHRNPLFALGVVCMLSDGLSARARGTD